MIKKKKIDVYSWFFSDPFRVLDHRLFSFPIVLLVVYLEFVGEWIGEGESICIILTTVVSCSRQVAVSRLHVDEDVYSVSTSGVSSTP